jgi:hypothetical protein
MSVSMPAFERRMLTIAPGASRAPDDADWPRAIVLVERGELELEGAGGTRRTFGSGDLIWMDDVPLRALRNRGPGEVVLLGVFPARGSTT